MYIFITKYGTVHWKYLFHLFHYSLSLFNLYPAEVICEQYFFCGFQDENLNPVGHQYRAWSDCLCNTLNRNLYSLKINTSTRKLLLFIISKENSFKKGSYILAIIVYDRPRSGWTEMFGCCCLFICFIAVPHQ